jgi:cytochrome P450
MSAAELNSAPELDLDPFSLEFLVDPYPSHATLRDAGPVVRLSRYGIWAVARYAEVLAVLQDWKTFCSGRGTGLCDLAKEEPWWAPSIVLEADPPLHTRTRSVLSKVLSRPALMRLREDTVSTSAWDRWSHASRRRFCSARSPGASVGSSSTVNRC